MRLLCQVVIASLLSFGGQFASDAFDGEVILKTTTEPADPIDLNNRGVLAGCGKNWSDAIAYGEAAVQAAPLNPTYRRNLSMAYLKYADIVCSQKQFDQALKNYRMALFIDPLNKPASNNLEMVLAKSGMDPKDSKYRKTLAEAFFAQGNYRESAVEYQAVAKVEDSGPVFFTLGEALIKAKDIDRAKYALNAALEKSWPPGSSESHKACKKLFERFKDSKAP